ncbi:MAG: ABC transporter ATP-binding protein [Anaerolineales bacterium]|nr:ABC transporter ATP-binding protein [Anaerolineales bacterium]
MNKRTNRNGKINGQLFPGSKNEPETGQNGALIELRGVRKAYHTSAGDLLALDDINFKVWPGEFLTIIGKSGAGKSTLINMITGIDQPSLGQIIIGDHALHKMNEEQKAVWRGKHVGVVFQTFHLLPMLTCVQNVMLPMDFANLYNSTRERRKRAITLLEQVGIPEQADKLPGAVSGGQRQRVAIARALANDPMFIAADEPTGNLDSKTAGSVIDVLEQLAQDGKTIVMVTHDNEMASRSMRTIHIADGKLKSNLPL